MTLSTPRWLALAAALVLAAAPAWAQGARVAPPPDEHIHGGIHVLTAGPNGTLQCDVAAEELATELRRVPSEGIRLTPLASLNDAPEMLARRGGGSFRIILRATDQLLARPEALMAFRRAAARWERIIQTPITAVIDVDFGPNRFNSGPFGPNILASANSAQAFATATSSPAEFVARILERVEDPQTAALVSAIPLNPTPSTIGGEDGSVPLGRGVGGLITLQSLGFRPANIDPNPAVNPFGTVPNIGFNSAFAYDFNPNDGVTAGQTDFEGVTIHEIGHVLGFTSSIGATAQPAQFSVWDLYRVRPDAVTPGEPLDDGQGWEVAPRVVSPGPVATEVWEVVGATTYFRGTQVIFDGLAEYETSTARGDRTGGDGQQASHWRNASFRPPSLGADRNIGIMNPTIGPGVRDVIKAPDIRVLELLGYLIDRRPVLAQAAVTLEGEPVNIDFLTPVVRRGVPVAGGTLTLVISNVGSGKRPLDYEVVFQTRSTDAAPGQAAPRVDVVGASGSLAPAQQETVTLTVANPAGTGAILTGAVQIRLTDPDRAFVEIPLELSIGTAALGPAGAPFAVFTPSGGTAPAQVELRNDGQIPLSYVRVLEPAITALEAEGLAPVDLPEVRAAFAATDAADDVPADAARGGNLSLQIGGSPRLNDLTQLPTGEVVVLDGADATSGRVFTVAADLSSVLGTFNATGTGGSATGIAYNDRTASLWMAVQQTQTVREFRLEGEQVVWTGRDFGLPFEPFGMDYSPELDAFFIAEADSPLIHAVDAQGVTLPGYPAVVESRRASGTPTPGVSFTKGLLETTSFTTRYNAAGQFGRPAAGAPAFSLLQGGTYGIKRSRLDPDGVLYYTNRTTNAQGFTTMRTIDPADITAALGTRILAEEPLYLSVPLAPAATRTLRLIVDGVGLPENETVTDELAFFTNAPTARVVRIPVTVTASGVSSEGGPSGVLASARTLPNPVRGTATVRVALAEAAEVRAEVFSVLGQRVAVLADGAPMPAGSTDLALDTRALAAGVYVVRVQVGADVLAHKLTVLR